MNKKQTDIFLAAAAMTLMAAFALQAQVAPKVRLEKIYTIDTLVTGNPLPEIMKALRSKAKNAPKEDIDWLINIIRLNIVSKTRILYTNKGKAIKLPEDIKEINSSKNHKYLTIIVDNHGDAKRYMELGKVNPPMLRIRTNIFMYSDLVERDTNSNKYRDSLEYWKKQILVHDQKVKGINDTYKNIKYAMLMRAEDGVVLWKRDDIEEARYVSGNGKITVATHDIYEPLLGHNLFFYNQDGTLINKYVGVMGPSVFGDLADDGSMYCITSYENNGSILLTFDNNGKEIWRYQTGLGYPDNSFKGLVISPAKNYILTTISPKTLLFNNTGKLIAENNYVSDHPIFSKDEKYLVSNWKDTLFIYNIERSELNKLEIGGLKYGGCLGVLSSEDDLLLAIRRKTEDGMVNMIINNKGEALLNMPKAFNCSPRGSMLKADDGIYIEAVNPKE